MVTRERPRGRSTLAAFDPRNNSLNALRLVLATLVLVGHAWVLGGVGGQPSLGGTPIGHLAVAGFFAISGWLISQSRLSSPLPAYAWRRALRIYPAFWVALVVVGFGFAPVSAALGDGGWSPVDGLRYVLVNATIEMRDFGVGATLAEVPYPSAWNGSLWTLLHEVACYVVVGILATVVPRRWVTPSVVVVWVATTVAGLLLPHGSVPYLLGAFLGLAPYFFAGAALFVLRERIPLTDALGGLSTLGAGAALLAGVDARIVALPLAYTVLWMGHRLPLRRLGRRNDLSYGMYIYAFPVQQLLAQVGVPAAGIAVYVVLAMLGTVPVAALSWFLVERPTMRWRRAADRLPRRRTSTAASGAVDRQG